MPKFEDHYEEIEKAIERRRRGWKLEAIKYVDFDDIKQEIITHIWQKWHMYDPERPLINWVNRIITNQMYNAVRDHYANFQKPCAGCDMNLGANLCAYTKSGIQCTECKLFKEWTMKKKSAYEIELASDVQNSMEFSPGEGTEDINYKQFLEQIGVRVKTELHPTAYKIYRLIYIEGNDETKVAKMLKFKIDYDDRGRPKENKQIANYKKKFKEIVKDVLSKEDYRFIDGLEDGA